MARNEAETRFSLIDPILIDQRGWLREDIRVEQTAAQIDIVYGKGQRRPAGRADYLLCRPLTEGTVPIPLAIIEAKREDLPPLAVQRRIAARLSEDLAAIAQARNALEAQLASAKALHAANLRAGFRSSEAQGWPVLRLEDTSEISGGFTLGRDFRGRTTRNVPYLRVANVKDGRLDLSEVKTTPATAEDISALRLRVGDILLTEGGDPDKLGRGTFWRGEIAECIHQNHIFRVRFDLSHFEPAFVAYQFGSSYGKSYFAAHAKQTTGIATINRRVLGAFPLMTPPLETQRRIAKRLDAEYAAANALRIAIEAKLANANKLPAASLRAAFQSGN